jgi:phage gpG-like protein
VISISIETDGTLSLIRERLENLSPALERAARIALDSVRRNVEAGGRPPWPPLKDKSRTPLIKTGSLLHSLTSGVSGNEAFVGTLAPYAVFQEEGTKSIPARPFMHLQEENLGAMEEAITDYLLGGI